MISHSALQTNQSAKHNIVFAISRCSEQKKSGFSLEEEWNRKLTCYFVLLDKRSMTEIFILDVLSPCVIRGYIQTENAKNDILC